MLHCMITPHKESVLFRITKAPPFLYMHFYVYPRMQIRPILFCHLLIYIYLPLASGGFDNRLRENVEYLEELKSLAEREGVSQKVKFITSCSTAERNTLLSHCLCVLYTPKVNANPVFTSEIYRTFFHRRSHDAYNYCRMNILGLFHWRQWQLINP